MNTETEVVATIEYVLRDKDGNIKQVGNVEPKEGVTFDEMVAALGTAVEAVEKESE